MGKRGCLRDSVSGSRCFPGEQFGENRDKQLTTVRDNQLWFLCFLFFCFFEMFFLPNTVVNKWPLFVTTSSQLSTQLLQAINSLDSCYGLSTALTAVSSRLERVACQGSYGSCCKLSTHFTVVGSFDSWNKLSSVLASCFNLLTAIAFVTSCQ